MRISNDGIEDTEHFLLLCPSFDIQRRDLLAGVLALVRLFGLSSPSNEILTQLLMNVIRIFLMKSVEISLSYFYVLSMKLVDLIEFVQFLAIRQATTKSPLKSHF